MKNIILLLIIFSSGLIAQTKYGSISGFIIDEQTKQPIENVNAYIANSTNGSSSNKQGKFLIKNIPPGRYTLILSHLSYENQYLKIDIKSKETIELSIKLSPKPIEFPEIDVSDLYDSEWWKNYELFKNGLLGSTWFVDGCEIMNPYSIFFNEDANGTLLAKTDEPIEIENKSLGYNILYELEYYSYDGYETKYSGYPHFKEMTSKFKEDYENWEIARLEAYMGSLRHFLRTLAKSYELIKEKKDSVSILIDIDDVTEDGTKFIYDDNMFMSKNGFDAYLIEYYLGSGGRRTLSRVLYPDSIITESALQNELFIVTDQPLQITYNKEYHDLRYEPQYSQIKLHSDSVYFDKQGRYHDQFMLQTFGYMARQRLAEMLPFEYEPSDSLIINTDFR